jgi:hypothetical protein
MGCGRPRHGRPGDPAQPIGDIFEIVTGRGGRGVGRLHLRVHLSAMHLNAARSFDAEPDRVAPDIQDDDPDVVTNHNAFPGAACEHQHSGLLPWTPQGCGSGWAVDRSTSGQLQAVRRC